MLVSKDVLIDFSDQMNLGYKFISKFDLTNDSFEVRKVINQLENQEQIFFLAYKLGKKNEIIEFCRLCAKICIQFVDPALIDSSLDIDMYDRFLNLEDNVNFLKILAQAKNLAVSFSEYEDGNESHILSLTALRMYTFVDFYYNASMVYRGKNYEIPFMGQFDGNFCVEAANEIVRIVISLTKRDEGVLKMIGTQIWLMFQDEI